MYYIIVLVLLFLTELFYFKLANKFNIIDKPNERSSHRKVTLRGGGIIFYFGALVYFLANHWELVSDTPSASIVNVFSPGNERVAFGNSGLPKTYSDAPGHTG